MIRARHLPFWVWFSRQYTKFHIAYFFRKVEIISEPLDHKKPFLVIANHFSWWDGIVMHYLSFKFFRKRFFAMMLEDQLKTRMFLNKLGMFSIKKGNRDIIRAINYSSEILNDKKNLLLMYPQGKIESAYHYPVKFEPGMIKILQKLNQPVELIFLVLLIEYFAFKKPTLFLYIKPYPFQKGCTIEEIEQAYNEHLISSIKQQKE